MSKWIEIKIHQMKLGGNGKKYEIENLTGAIKDMQVLCPQKQHGCQPKRKSSANSWPWGWF